jgi:CubicO group peptidase (beta-lactamase class C family)
VTTTSPDNALVASGYEPVAELFEAFRTELSDPGGLGLGGGAFCAYLDGTKIVDLWGGTRRGTAPWTADTMAILMSATKGLSTLCVQLLYDRQLVDVDAPVADYWPEFAAAGKAHVRVRQLLNHTVGLVGLPNAERLLDWTGHGWDDLDAIADDLAAAAPAWTPGSRIGYHAVTIGWLLGELVRRITGESIGTFFRREIAGPIELDAWIGTPVEQQCRIADVLRERTERLSPEQAAVYQWHREQQRVPDSLPAQAGLLMHGRSVGDDLPGFMNLPRIRALEIPAANGSATARSLARMYALLTNNGEIDGVRLLSPETVTRFARPTARGDDAVTAMGVDGASPVRMAYALGYECNVLARDGARLGPSADSYGHAGAGGQLGFSDPSTGIAIGYVRSHLTVEPRPWDALVDAVYSCAGRRNAGVLVAHRARL